VRRPLRTSLLGTHGVATRGAESVRIALPPLLPLTERPPFSHGGSADPSRAELNLRSAAASSPRLEQIRASRRDGKGSAPDVDVVIPVYDGERVLAASVRRLHSFLSAELPFSWRIVIVDNGSTDRTPAIAARLSDELPRLRTLRLEAKGRGRALRAAWSASDARVVCYMDVDLSTDLNGLLPLIAPLLSGHSDVAIGTRLARGARVTRGTKRELISRTYNRLLRLALRARFSDAQCGFKAVRGDLVGGLVAAVRDQAWFFDTELLIFAQRSGLRIHEVPVDWVEGPDTTVDIMATALADLRGVARLAIATPIARFVAVGIASTVAYALLLLALMMPLGSEAANALALAITAIGNTAANRRVTFGVRGRERLLAQHAAGGLVFAIALGLTSGALAVLHGLDPRAPQGLKLTVLIVASLAATATRYVALRTWVFSPNRCALGEGTGRTSPTP
jgi:glycosyltransferase involved in cell wall biosynthesis